MKLGKRELDCAMLMNELGKSVRQAARDLGVAESTLRERLKRTRSGAVDGRSLRASSCDAHAESIGAWLERQRECEEDGSRPEGVEHLLGRLRGEGYRGSYASVRRYVRKRSAAPKVRPVRRVETRPGAQAQVDWVSRELLVEELGGLVKLHAFVMTLSHSRMWAVEWSERQDLLSWLECHNLAFTWLGGVAYGVRIDNLKTGVSGGSGPWAVLQPGYASYAKQVGFVIDPCRVRRASDKGKVERRGRDLAWLGVTGGERFATLAALREETRRRVEGRSRELVCPVTGTSVYEAWQGERGALGPLPASLPEPFDVEVARGVGRDCLVSFEGRQYSVPFLYAGREVRVRGCRGRVEVYHDGRLLSVFPRGTACRLLVDQDHYEGEGDGRVAAPTPLGKMGREIVLPRSWEGGAVPAAAAEPAARGIGVYERLVNAMS